MFLLCGSMKYSFHFAFFVLFDVFMVSALFFVKYNFGLGETAFSVVCIIGSHGWFGHS